MSRKSKSQTAVAIPAAVPPNPNALSFSLKQAAAVTGVALWAIRSAVWARKLPARVIGKRQIVLRSDLEKWIANQPTAHGRAA
jgi:hypothetical protein